MPIVISLVNGIASYKRGVDNGTKRAAVVTRLVEALKKERIRQKRSLNDIAAGAGLSHTMVSRVEKRERMPTIDTLLRIAEALGVDLGEFLASALKPK